MENLKRNFVKTIRLNLRTKSQSNSMTPSAKDLIEETDNTIKINPSTAQFREEAIKILADEYKIDMSNLHQISNNSLDHNNSSNNNYPVSIPVSISNVDKQIQCKIVCSSSSLYEKLKNTRELLTDRSQNLNSKFTEETFAQIFNKAHQHFVLFQSNSQFLYFKNRELIITDNLTDSGDSKLQLDPPAPYKLFPEELKFYDEVSKSEFTPWSQEFMLRYNSIKSPFKSIKIELDRNSDSLASDEVIYRRFEKFLIFFFNTHLKEIELIKDIKHGAPLIHITKDQVEFLVKQLDTECYGLKALTNKLQKLMMGFINPVFDRPKGIIFDGPPRSGKTYTTSKVIDYLKLFKIYRSLSAGDFMQSLQGQSEKMVDAITSRCDVLPWELCILYIDEVDSLAPSRTLNSSSNSQNSIIGQFLAVTDGNKKKLNLLMVATTNRLAAMDQAFVERYDIKLFLGVPNYEARQNWIKTFVTDYIKISNKNGLNVLFSKDFPYQNMILNMSLNFSADAMKKVLSKIINDIEINYSKDGGRNLEGLKNIKLDNLIYASIRDVCKNDSIFFGKYVLADLVNEMPANFESIKKYKNMSELFSIMSGPQKNQNIKFTGRILIDLKEAKDEVIQIETRNNGNNLSDEQETILIDESKLHFQLNRKYSNSTIEKYYTDKNSLIEDAVDLRNLYESKIKSGSKNTTTNNNNNEKITKVKKALNECIENDESNLEENLNKCNYLFKLLENLFLKELIRQSVNNLLDVFKSEEMNELKEELQSEFANEKINIEKSLHLLGEIINACRSKNDTNNKLKSFGPLLNFDNKDEVIKLLLHFAVKNNMDYVLLIDMEEYLRKSMLLDDKIGEETNFRIVEAKKYEKCMIIFDFDSICNIYKENSNMKQDLFYSSAKAYDVDESDSSFNYRYTNPNTFKICLQHFESVLADFNSSNWCVAISSHNKVTLDFKEKLNWPKTENQKKVERFIEEQLIEKVCKFCREHFTDKTNKADSCKRHEIDLFYLEKDHQKLVEIYNLEKMKFNSANKDAYGNKVFEKDPPSRQLCKLYRREEIEYLNRERKILFSDVRYVCCGKGMGEKGEVPTIHQD